MAAIRLALVWHLHQPSYRDALTERALLPWARLHATKDYRKMAAILRRHPRVHATFNLTPSLLGQLEALAGGGSDLYLDVARRPADSLSPAERRFILSRFFAVNRRRMLEPHARYRDLFRRVAERSGVEPSQAVSERIDANALPADALRDLQVWFHLAWVDPSYRGAEPIRSLLEKGSGFSEEEKLALLDWGVTCAAAVAGDYRELAETGQVELSTSAFHHPILPLLIDGDAPRECSSSIALPSPPLRAPEDSAEQLRRARESHARRFGGAPRGTWPPEGAVSDAALALMAESGFTWAASDEAVLAGALEARDGSVTGWPGALYRPYRVETTSGPLAMVFRDRALSDRIGFTYMHWEAERAAGDFLARVREAGRAGGEGALVTVILDGENCWEHYEEDGRPFLDCLYGRLGEAEDIVAVTVSEGLESMAPDARLPRVPVGSWIRSDLAIWIGHPDKNRAWTELRLARDAIREAPGPVTAASRAAAMEEIYAAEASDWFWWYGDDHQTDQSADLDLLFRAHLARAYAIVATPTPASLATSLRADAAPSAGSADPSREVGLRPTLDGRETDLVEWGGAMRFSPGGEAGTMHRASALLQRIWYGVAGGSLWLRVDLAEPGRAGAFSGAALVVAFAGPNAAVARHRLGESLERGVPDWSGSVDGVAAGDAGEYALDQILESRLPLERCGGAPGAALQFRVSVSGPGVSEVAAPAAGWLSLAIPDREAGFKASG